MELAPHSELELLEQLTGYEINLLATAMRAWNDGRPLPAKAKMTFSLLDQPDSARLRELDHFRGQMNLVHLGLLCVVRAREYSYPGDSSEKRIKAFEVTEKGMLILNMHEYLMKGRITFCSE